LSGCGSRAPERQPQPQAETKETEPKKAAEDPSKAHLATIKEDLDSAEHLCGSEADKAAAEVMHQMDQNALHNQKSTMDDVAEVRKLAAANREVLQRASANARASARSIRSFKYRNRESFSPEDQKAIQEYLEAVAGRCEVRAGKMPLLVQFADSGSLALLQKYAEFDQKGTMLGLQVVQMRFGLEHRLGSVP